MVSFAILALLFISACAPSSQWRARAAQGDQALHEGRYAEAEKLYLQTIHLLERNPSANSAVLASRLSDLALFYQTQNRPQEAETYHSRSIALTEKTVGKEHLLTAQRVNDLAFFYQSQGKYEKAEPAYLKALAIQEKNFPQKSHPKLLDSYASLALFYEAQEKFANAESFYLKAIAAGDPVILNNYANFLRKTGRSEEVRQMEMRAKSALPAKKSR